MSRALPRTGLAVGLSCAALACNDPFLRDIDPPLPSNTAQACAPDAAVATFTVAVESDRVALFWASEASDADGVAIERRDPTTDTPFTVLSRVEIGVTSYDDYTIERDRRYTYRARTYRQPDPEKCTSPPTEEEQITTYPHAPEAFAVISDSVSGAQLRWTDLNSYETGYRVERQADGEGYVFFCDLVAGDYVVDDSATPPNGETVFWVDDTLELNRTYDYRLSAFNSFGVSEYRQATQRASFPPQLDWAGAPWIETDCALVVPGSATFDSDAGAQFASATGAVTVNASPVAPVVADASGFRTVLTDLTPGTVATAWAVTDSKNGQSSVSRDLQLGSTLVLRSVARDPTPTLGDDLAPGRQALLPSCSSCTPGPKGSLAVGQYFSCALGAAGDVRCWGLDDGALGVGETDAVYWPEPVCAGGVGSPCAAALTGVDLEVGIGDYSSYASTVCTRSAFGDVKCWGWGAGGQLGTGTQADETFPIEVCASGTGPDCEKQTGIRQLAVGRNTTCGRLDSGRVLCWGSNTYSQLGIGQTGLWAPWPVRVCDTGSFDGSGCAGGAPLEDVSTIVAGASHFCALIEPSGNVKCWGRNQNGQLGDGSTSDRMNPVTVVDASLAPIADIVEVSSHGDHTCALSGADGSVFCWGENWEGQLGNGLSGADSTTATPVCASGFGSSCAPLVDVSQISAGYDYTCALLDSSEARCWGDGGYGALGKGDSSDASNPVPVCVSGAGLGCPPLSGIARIEAGIRSTCAVMQGDGAVYCWGEGSDGQLGNGTDSDSELPVQMCSSGAGATCVPVSGVVFAKPGFGFTCLLMQESGEIRCLGFGDNGELGNGTGKEQKTAITVCDGGVGVACPPLLNVVAITSGEDHSCALTDAGSVKCWGRDAAFGETGAGYLDRAWEPAIAAVGDVCSQGTGPTCVPLTGVVSVTAGGRHTCAVMSDSTVRCWGDNSQGQIGDGSVIVPPVDDDCNHTNLDLGCADSSMICDLDTITGSFGDCVEPPIAAPVAVRCGTGSNCSVGGPLDEVISLAAGARHTCAVRVDHSVKCWGSNTQRQCGSQTVSQQLSLPIDVPALEAVALAAGAAHTCAVSPAGEVHCWGANDQGQLGDGTSVPRVSPVKVCASGSGVTCPPLAGAIALTAGDAFTCALMEDGAVTCWGANERGQIGNGTTNSPVSTPTPVCAADASNACDATAPCTSLLSDVLAIDAGQDHVCALLTDQRVTCWGNGRYSQLASGNGFSSCVPTPGVCMLGASNCGDNYHVSDFAVRSCELATITAP